MLNLQLPYEAEKHLAWLAKHSGKSTDDYAKDAILAHLASKQPYDTPNQQAINDWVERTSGMVKVNAANQNFDLMRFDVADHITLFDEEEQ